MCRSVLERNAYSDSVSEGLAKFNRMQALHDLKVAEEAAVKAALAEARAKLAKGPYSGAIDVINTRAPGSVADAAIVAGGRPGVVGAAHTGFVCPCPRCGAPSVATTDACVHATCGVCNTDYCACCGTSHGEATVTYPMVSNCAFTVKYGQYMHTEREKQLQAGVMAAMAAQRELAKVPGAAVLRTHTSLDSLHSAAALANLVVVQPGDAEFFYRGITAAPVLLPSGLKFPPDFSWFTSESKYQAVLRIVLSGAALAAGDDVVPHYPQFNHTTEQPDFSVTGLMAPLGKNDVMDLSPWAIKHNVLSPEATAFIKAMFRPSCYTPFGTDIVPNLLNAKRALIAAAYLQRVQVSDSMLATRMLMRMTAYRIAGTMDLDGRFPITVLDRLAACSKPDLMYEHKYLIGCVLRKSSPLVDDVVDLAFLQAIDIKVMSAFCRINHTVYVAGMDTVVPSELVSYEQRCYHIFKAFCYGVPVVFHPAAYIAWHMKTRGSQHPEYFAGSLSGHLAITAPSEFALISGHGHMHGIHPEYREYILGDAGKAQHAAYRQSIAPKVAAPVTAGRKTVQAARATAHVRHVAKKPRRAAEGTSDEDEEEEIASDEDEEEYAPQPRGRPVRRKRQAAERAGQAIKGYMDEIRRDEDME